MAIGLGVGAILFILTIAVLIYFCKMRRAIKYIDLKQVRKTRIPTVTDDKKDPID